VAQTFLSTDQVAGVYSPIDTGLTLTSPATTLENELNYLRQQVRAITGESSWIIAPDVTLAQVANGEGISNLPFSATNTDFASDVLDTTRRKIFPNISEGGGAVTLNVNNQSVNVTSKLTGVPLSTTAPTYNSGTRVWDNLGATVYVGTDIDGNKGQVRSASGLDPVTSGGHEVYSRLTNKSVTAQPTNITGVTVTYAAYEAASGNLVYTNSGTTLAWAGGAAVNVSSGGHFRLQGSTAANVIVVNVVPGSLPGSDQTDALTFVTTDQFVGFFYNNGSVELPYAFGSAVARVVRYQQWVSGSSSLLEDSGRLIICNNSAVDVTETSNINQLRLDLGVTLSGTGSFSNPFGDSKSVVTKVTDHIAGTSEKHAASDIVVTPTGNLSSINVQAALAELQGDIDSISGSTALNDHLNDTADAHDASAISTTAISGVTGTDVQAMLASIQGNLETHLNDTVDAHDASAISITSGQATALGAASETVAAALTALDDTIDTHITDSTDPHGTTLTQTNLTVTGVGQFDGNVTLGNAVGDLLVVNATLNANLVVASGVTIDGVDISALNTSISDHINDTVDAHDASAISFVNTTSGLTATTVQAALDEIDGLVDDLYTELGTLSTSRIDDLYTKTGVPNIGTSLTWSGTNYLNAATTLKGAVEALDTSLDAVSDSLIAHTGDSTDPHGTTLTQTNLTVTGTTLLNGATTLGDASGDTITVNGTATFAELLTASSGVATASVASGATLALTAVANITFDDAQLTAPVKVSNTATSLLSSTGGIVDALNEAFKGTVKQRGSGAGTGNATVNLNTVTGITSYFSNRGGSGVGDTSEGFYMEVHVNGMLQRAGATFDYREDTTTGTGRTTITFIGKTPNANDVITAIVYRL
jgi:hypothetical protein